jgi:hypothetical protein
VKKKISAYEAPAVTILGKIEALTLQCDKNYGGSDGFTFQQAPISCTSS